MESIPATNNQQGSDAQKQQVEALTALISAYGLDAADLVTAIQTLAEAKKATAPEPEKGKSIYQDKESVYDDEHAFIYRRGDTATKRYYLRIYDETHKKPFIKALGTTDRVRALATARSIYQDIKGKIDRGERLKTINSKELVALYLNSLHISAIPHAGVTPECYRQKEYFLRNWLDYISHKGYENTSIDKINPQKTRDYGDWFRSKPKKDGTPRSAELINNSISEVLRAYKRLLLETTTSAKIKYQR